MLNSDIRFGFLKFNMKMFSHAQKLISSFLTMLRKLTLMLLRPIDKVDEVDLSRKSSHTTHHHHHLNFTSLFFASLRPCHNLS